MNRTVRATLVAGLSVAASVVGLGVLLGFDLGSAAVTAVVLGAAMASLIWFAARRAETFHDPGQPGSSATGGAPGGHDDRRTDP